MTLEELLKVAGALLEGRNIPYFAFGATAMNFWIPPRMTVDLDLVVCVDKRKGRALLDLLRESGFRITRDYDRKFLEGRKIRIPIGDTELDLQRGLTRHDREALRRSHLFEAGDHRLRVAAPEDILLYKLRYWRRQDQADIERLLKERRDLDRGYILAWLDVIEDETGEPVSSRWREAAAPPRS